KTPPRSCECVCGAGVDGAEGLWGRWEKGRLSAWHKCRLVSSDQAGLSWVSQPYVGEPRNVGPSATGHKGQRPLFRGDRWPALRLLPPTPRRPSLCLQVRYE